jgi:uncharacterized lipoprotein
MQRVRILVGVAIAIVVAGCSTAPILKQHSVDFETTARPGDFIIEP